MQRRVFVAQAYLAYGGTYMAYHLGRILQLGFGLKCYACSHKAETADLAQRVGIYPYDLSMPSIPMSDIGRYATCADILIACDIGSEFLLGWKFPGIKIGYVQSLQPTYMIDMRFDHYISASNIIADYLKSACNIYTNTIPPFVNHEMLPASPEWLDRPANVISSYRKATKGRTELWDLSFKIIHKLVSDTIPGIVFEDPLFNESREIQSDLLARIARARYLLMLTEMEGFGLIPLEAMALGTIPIGYDGFGGGHYMRPWVNCAVVPCAKAEQAAESIIRLIRNEHAGQAMSDRARLTAKCFDYKSFEAAWTSLFSNLLGIAPSAQIGTAYRGTRQAPA
jgi:hypothetical protein